MVFPFLFQRNIETMGRELINSTKAILPYLPASETTDSDFSPVTGDEPFLPWVPIPLTCLCLLHLHVLSKCLCLSMIWGECLVILDFLLFLTLWIQPKYDPWELYHQNISSNHPLLWHFPCHYSNPSHHEPLQRPHCDSLLPGLPHTDHDPSG